MSLNVSSGSHLTFLGVVEVDVYEVDSHHVVGLEDDAFNDILPAGTDAGLGASTVGSVQDQVTL